MSSRNTIQNELKSLDSNLPVTDSPSFSVPEGYFEGLAEAVLAKVKNSEASSVQTELHELSPLLAGISKATPYSVPFSYFDENLESALHFGIEKESAVLEAIGKDLPYEVPAGYFDSLSTQILAKVSKPKARVIPLFARSWTRVAAAAVVAGALVFGGLRLFTTNGDQSGTQVAQHPADISAPYVAQAKPAIVQEIKKTSTKDLEAFIESVPTTASASLTKKEPVSKEETKELLKDVSVDEMENFLSAVPQTDELAAIDQP
jgi:hypothetical protein